MSNLLGVAICDECNSRIRVLSKHKALVGKAVRCPRCHTHFKLEIEEASNSDVVAVEADESAKKRRRRSKDEIRQGHVDCAREGYRALHARLKDIDTDRKSSEEQVRIWCIDALRTALGYEDSDLDTEHRVMGGRVDIAVKCGDEVVLVIECKNIRSRLRSNAREQAGVYAATLSAPWAVLTNGDIWKLYRVVPQRGQSPRMDLVFDIALLDDDGISDLDAECLYLLTKRALKTGDTEREYHSVMSTSPKRMYNALFSDRVINAIRIQLKESYRTDFDERIGIEAAGVEESLHDLLTPLEFGT